jgi:non-ribosomal peptide synthetase component F
VTVATCAQVAELWNVYGPTETTVWSTAGLVTAAGRAVGIGRPLHNTQVYVLDDDLRLAAVGEVGRIFIGGVGLSPGGQLLLFGGEIFECVSPDFFVCGGEGGEGLLCKSAGKWRF